MLVEIYNTTSGTVIDHNPPADDVAEGVPRNMRTELEDVIQGNHARPTLFRCKKDTESTLISVSLTLADGDLSGITYSFFTSPTFIPNVSQGVQIFTPISVGFPISIPVSDSVSDYVWIDVATPSNITGPVRATLSLSYNFS